MAAPSYTEDLTDIATADETSGWDESSDTTWDDQGPPAYEDADYPYIQGNFAVTADCTKSGIGTIITPAHGSDISLPTDGAYLVWQNFSSPLNLNTYANGGLRVTVGSDTGTFYSWDVGGSDAGRNPYGGWQNHAVNPTVTADDTVNSYAGANQQYVGAGVNLVSGIGKGEVHQVDAIRFGRCSSIYEFGELISEGDGSDDPATFAGFAAQNDNNTNRWGLMQIADGGYLWKGKMTLGTATNACTFQDSNTNIFIDVTPKVTAGFNLIEINNAGSYVSLTNVQFTKLQSAIMTGASPGNFNMTADATVELTSCSFTDMGTFTFDSNATNTGCVFRRCSTITTGGGTFTGCIFDSSSNATSMSLSAIGDLTTLTDNTFVSDGTGHAIDFGTISSSVSVDWENTLDDGSGTEWTGSVGTTVGVAGTANDAILVEVAASQTLTINVGSTATTPTVQNTGTGTVTIVAGSVTTQVTVKDTSTPPVAIQDAQVLAWVADGTNFPYQDSITIVGSGTTATVAHTAHGRSSGDNMIIEGANEDYYNGVYAITVTGPNAYTYTASETLSTSPATGTIIATLALINDATPANGIVSDTRPIPSNQPIICRVRKSPLAGPWYKQGYVVDTVDSTTGFSVTVQLQDDD